MQVRKAVLRAAGAAMVACAIAPWIGAGSASAAGIAYVDPKWGADGGTNSATNQTVLRDSCAYDELADMPHAGTGWHFVMTGGDGLTTFTAHFVNAGDITVTTTDGASGAIVQDGKGAVVYTPTDDTLINVDAAPFNGHSGYGSAAIDDVMQLSHLCTGVTETPTPTPSESTTPVTTPVSTPVTTPVSTPPTTASQQVSVLPTKKSTPKTSVLGTKAGSELPHTGNSLPVTALVVISLGLLAGGGALVAAPAVARSKKPRRH
jgi:hypothetical protein